MLSYPDDCVGHNTKEKIMNYAFWWWWYDDDDGDGYDDNDDNDDGDDDDGDDGEYICEDKC